MTAPERDAQFVEQVTKLIVEHPESVEVNRTIDDLGVLITLRVHPEDMATIIGREGRSAKAIRTLLRIIGAKEDARVNLKIVEPDGSDSRPATDTAEGDQPAVEASQPVVSEPEAAPEAPAEESNNSHILDDIPEPLA